MPPVAQSSPSHPVKVMAGKALLASGALMGLFGAAIAMGWIARDLEPRGLVAAALLVAAAFDVMLGLRFLGERSS
jgi:hypothetical protein